MKSCYLRMTRQIYSLRPKGCQSCLVAVGDQLKTAQSLKSRNSLSSPRSPRKFINLFTRVCQLFLSQVTHISILTFHFLNASFKIIFPYMPRPSKGSSSINFSEKICVQFSPPCVYQRPSLTHILQLQT